MNVKKCISLLLMLTMLVISMSSATYGLQTLRSIPSAGLISYGVQTYDVLVSVKTDSVITKNTLSLGFQLDGYDIRRFRDRTVLQNYAKEANFKLVRFFHHRLGQPSGTGSVPCSSWNEATQTGVWDGWSQVDPLIEKIFAIGAEPLICFGYVGSSGRMSVPSGMATDNDGLPRPQTWANYCVQWIRHFKEKGYPVRFYEIVNEPYQLYFWKNQTKLANYVNFWNTVARAMRKENPNILISSDCTTVKHALDYWIVYGDDIDFLDLHKYDWGRTTPTDEELLQKVETYLFDYGDNEYPAYSFEEAREKWRAARGKYLPIIIGETNLSWKYNPTDPRIQQPIGMVWSALVIRTGILKGLNYHLYWNLAGTSPDTGENFGMINGIDNVPYRTYYMQKLIGSNLAVGDSIVQTNSSSDDVRSLAWKHNGQLNIFLICKVNKTRTVALSGVEGTFNSFKIDSSNTAIQNGKINLAQEKITMNGYSIVLLQASG